MKLIKLSFIIAVAVLALVGISATSYAFHDGGVARCEGCHTMHNSFQGTAMKVGGGMPDASASNIYLLQGTDQSSTCLNCHQKSTDTQPSSYHVSTVTGATLKGGVIQRGPGGDFAWVRINYQSGTSTSGKGQRHGHNIIATNFDYTSDNTNTVAPGGTYLASELSCISCHDPHANARRDEFGAVVHRNTSGTFPSIMASGSTGTLPSAGEAVGVFRFLGGAGYKPASVTSAAFTAEPPVAQAPSTYNRSESATDTYMAYGSGMSEWCANCHTGFLNTTNGNLGSGGHPHPAGAAITSATIIDNYNHYVMTGNMTGSGYSSLVPFEQGGAPAYPLTLPTAATQMASGNVVMCLSCHRAHASGFDSMIRWYNSDAFVTEDGAYYTVVNGNAPTSSDLASSAYYDRPTNKFATFQRVLCNKCHAKD